MAKQVKSTKASASQAAQPNKVSFLHLPAELRLQIYGYLLPDRTPRRGQNLRRDGQKASTNFMASCRQVHGEAADLLYGKNEMSVTISGWEGDSKTSRILLLNQEIELAEAAEAGCLLALRQVKGLRLYVSTGDRERSICDVRDAMFELLAHLGDRHHLRSLDVYIDVSTNRDFAYYVMSSNAAERIARIDTMQEFRHIKPGDLSRAHLTAFLTDPLRTVRNVKDGKKMGKVTLGFIGKTGRPWREVPRVIRDMARGNDAVVDYRPFSHYFEVLRQLTSAVGTLLAEAERWEINRTLAKLSAARIRGSAGAFRSQHDQLINIVQRSVNVDVGTATATYETESNMREVEYLLVALQAALPLADLDTSAFGYNESDRKLAEWKGRSKEEKKATKRKRKTGGDDQTEGSKKKAKKAGVRG